MNEHVTRGFWIGHFGYDYSFTGMNEDAVQGSESHNAGYRFFKRSQVYGGSQGITISASIKAIFGIDVYFNISKE